LIEFYCPGCATLVEIEYLPPGHPLTWDIQIDLAALKRKHGFEVKDLEIKDQTKELATADGRS
jgi:acetone carboxylase gamma subunit